MAQVINTNSLSLITQNNINKNQSAMSTAIERLSSGLRINSAKDDAAGQAIANRFTSNIKGLTQAARNANDGISLAQTTEGALSEINNNLQRVRELTVQAQNGTNSDSDLTSIQDEIKSRLSEIDRVSGQTQFNGVNVLAKNGTMSIQVGANDGQTIDIDLQKIDSSTLGLSGFNVQNSSTLTTTAVKSSFADSGTAIGAINVATLGAGATASAVSFDDITGKYYTTISGSANSSENGVHEVTAAAGSSTLGTSVGSIPVGSRTVTEIQTGTAINTTAAAATLVGANVTGATSANTSLVKVSATDSQGNVTDAGYAISYNGKLYKTDYNGADNTTIDVNTVKYTDSTGATATGAVELGGVDKQTAVVNVGGKNYAADQVSGHDFKNGAALTAVASTATTNPLEKLDQAISQIDKFRSSLGAVQNRLNSAVTNLNNTTTNLSEAQSRIQDADYATEVSNMSKAQIVQQAGNSVLAKANQVPQQVLSLLQG
ncbi:flagellin [Enterobacter hormaechei]|uniref:flagellin N-terminal helical domain-containing protein n=1 Tax=Enterobacter cloacae complex TaxID=354276 RepID=UPI0007356A55|nr:flagellin [Enterobacter hormaechei]CAE7068262.1 Flagellin [Enterobacter cloacae]KTH55552.1 flagellin [Enterobacter hormaechei subsp. xiangfangensis]MBJ6455166.1 flagellin FliC [Enterobacter hormaechei]MBJ6522774.1 flagellin FliC [Enterobacter hormaechei]MBK4625352.1 flagellin FliC [Enterobacter hormaechei]